MYRGFQNYKKKIKIARELVKILKFSLFVIAAILMMLNLQIFPKLSSLASISATNHLNRIIQTAISEYLANSDNEELVCITYDTEGNVTSLRAKTAALNRVRNELARAIISKLSESDIMQVKIPIGSIVGGSFLSGKGPCLTIKLALAQKYSASLSSKFEETGINQTRHVIAMELSLTTIMLLPGKNIEVGLKESYGLSETIIIGAVPDTYTKINRLTDDLTEEIIDDLYDFASLN